MEKNPFTQLLVFMRKLSITLCLGVFFGFLLGLGQVSGQAITRTSIGPCETGGKVTIGFSSLPDPLIQRLEESKERHEDMFASFEILLEEKAMRVECRYDDFTCDDLAAWIDSWLDKWNDEIHEDMLTN